MITKNEFYGQYLLSAGKADAAKPIGIYIERADAAWSVIEKLQKEKPLTEIQSNDGLVIGDPETIKAYNDNPGISPADPLTYKQMGGKASFFTDEQKAEIKAIVIGEPLPIIQSTVGLFIGNPEEVKSYNDRIVNS